MTRLLGMGAGAVLEPGRCAGGRLITDSMLTRATALGITVDGIDELERLYRFDGTEKFLRSYTQWDDARFLVTIGGTRYKDTLCGQLISRLRERQLFKRVYSASVNTKTFPRPEALEALIAPTDEYRARLELRIAHVVAETWGAPVDHRLVIVHRSTIESVREQSRNDEASILVDRPGGPIAFEEESALFRSIDASAKETFMEVYAPVAYADSADRRKKLESARALMTGVLPDAAATREEQG